jgi:hypothetical protein
MKPRLPNDEAYENGVLVPYYNKYWKPNVSTLPREDGSYIELNSDKLLNERTDYVEYVHQQNVSVTGMSIARRDYYKFVNYSNLEVYKNDMKLIQYEGNNKWKNVQQKTVEIAVNKVLDDFRDQIQRIEEIIYNMTHNICDPEEFRLPNPLFHLEDYSKNVAYKGDRNQNSTALAIVRELAKNKLDKMSNAEINTLDKEIMDEFDKEEEKHSKQDSNYRKREFNDDIRYHKIAMKLELIKMFERVSYVIQLTPEVKEKQKKGIANTGKTSDQVISVKLFEEKIRNEFPVEKYNELQYHDTIPYEQFIKLIMISRLDFKHYMESLCSSMALYAVEYLCENEIKSSNDCEEKVRMEIVKKAQDKAADILLKKYFKTGKKCNQEVKDIDKLVKKYRVSMTRKRFPADSKINEILCKNNLNELDNTTQLRFIRERIEYLYNRIELYENVIEQYNTNGFNKSIGYGDELLNTISKPGNYSKICKNLECFKLSLADLEFVYNKLMN